MPPHGQTSFADDSIEGKGYDSKLIKRLLHYVGPHRKLIFLAMFFMLISSSVELLLPYVTKTGIDKYLARLYQVYTDTPSACDSLMALSPADGDFIFLASDSLLIRKASMDGMDPATTHVLATGGHLRPETFYLFPAEQYEGETGRVQDDYWLVPEHDLGKIPPDKLMTIREKDIAGITRLALIFMGLLVLSIFAGYGHVMSLVVAGQRSMFDVRTELFNHIQTLSLNFFSKNPVGRLVTRVSNDVEALNEMFSAVLVNLVKDFLLIIGTITILLLMDWKLALISLTVLPVFTIASMIFRRKTRTIYRKVRKHLAELNSSIAEDVSGVKVIQIFRQEKTRKDKYLEINDNYYKISMKQLYVFGVFRPMIEVIAQIGTAIVLIYGGLSAISGALTIGALVAFISYVRQMFRPISDMSEKYNIMQGAMASSERIFKILDTQPEVEEAEDALAPGKLRGEVEFEDVDFQYVEDTPVLKDISFTIEPGKSIALVGPTGAGKSSIISLLTRFWDVGSGRILLDGTDIREHAVETLRKNTAIVLQDAFIFSRSVADNIRLSSDLTMEEVRKAADMVQATGFIDRLPQGFDTVMAERGATLSTGQKQLVCFARALAHDPRILILDEATSNVDPTTEQLIQRAIDTLMKGRTSIIVAHRLSTIQKCDEIIVIDSGRIMERGTHQELLARRGIYYNLYLLQWGNGKSSDQ
ncbi:MAG: ABC transporter ATP-binding protein [Candidatus Fermentibacteria bacterium]|nr:ABC transporter ATP-binding protein [Candidatus Fermentibacteria bacterium]